MNRPAIYFKLTCKHTFSANINACSVIWKIGLVVVKFAWSFVQIILILWQIGCKNDRAHIWDGIYIILTTLDNFEHWNPILLFMNWHHLIIQNLFQNYRWNSKYEPWKYSYTVVIISRPSSNPGHCQIHTCLFLKKNDWQHIRWMKITRNYMYNRPVTCQNLYIVLKT